MHSSLEATAAAAAATGHSTNNGAAATGAPPDGASGPAYESLYNEPEDLTGTRQTLIQVCIRICVHEHGARLNGWLRTVRMHNTFHDRTRSRQGGHLIVYVPGLHVCVLPLLLQLLLASKRREAGSQARNIPRSSLPYFFRLWGPN